SRCGRLAAATCRRSCNRCCRCGNAERLFEVFHELRRFQKRHALQKLNYIFTCCCHDYLSILLKGSWVLLFTFCSRRTHETFSLSLASQLGKRPKRLARSDYRCARFSRTALCLPLFR